MAPIVDEPPPHGVGLPPLAIDMPPPPPPPDPPPLNAEYRSSPTSAAPSAASALLPPPLGNPPSLSRAARAYVQLWAARGLHVQRACALRIARHAPAVLVERAEVDQRRFLALARGALIPIRRCPVIDAAAQAAHVALAER